MTQAHHVEDDDDLDLGDESIPEPSLEQQLSRLGFTALRARAKAHGLSGIGTTVDLVARIAAFERDGVIGEDDIILDSARAIGDLKPGIAPAPVDPATVTPAAGATQPASAAGPGQAAPVAPAPRRRQKVGFFADRNTYRAEFPIGPVAGAPDDNTHMRYIEGTHTAAREAGYTTRGFPHAGVRIGYSKIKIEGQPPMNSVIYEVFARREE